MKRDSTVRQAARLAFILALLLIAPIRVMCLRHDISGGGATLSSPQASQTQQAALDQLKKKNVKFDSDSFLTAVDNSDLPIVNLFLAAGIDSNSKENSGITALMIASGVGSTVGKLRLVGQGDSQVKRDIKNAIDIVRALIANGADVKAANLNGSTALHFAAASGNIAIAEILIDNGASVDEVNKVATTPLMMSALCNDQVNMPELLIRNGAKVSNSAGSSIALLYAASAGHIKVFQFLLSEGANPASMDSTGITALMEAASGGHADLVEMMIDLGVQVDTTDKSGYTALMFAAFNGQEEAIKVLLKHGANKNLTNRDGKTASSIAAGRNFPNAVKLLE